MSTPTPWSSDIASIAASLNADLVRGLTQSEAQKRLIEYGPNQLKDIKTKSVFEIWVDQFKSLIVALLASAALLSFVLSDFIEGFAIIAVLLINALIGFFTEWQAVRSMQSLRQLSQTQTRVRRDGQIIEIDAREIVPGDILILEAGDLVSADVRLITTSKLQLDESSLTGESLPVSKISDAVAPTAPLAERLSMAYKGTHVVRGSADVLVCSTGVNTELGHISNLVEQAHEEITPLEKRLAQLSRKLIGVTLVIAALAAVMGIVSGKDMVLMVETSIALAVAALPEGLPIVATIALARGMWRMAKRRAIINRLSAVETLGATSVICTDKTGTLTENKMVLTQAVASHETFTVSDTLNTQDTALMSILTTGVLCNNASIETVEGELKTTGDPVEVALLQAGAKASLDRNTLVAQTPEVREEAFDPEVKMMATFHQLQEGYRVAVKGAPEEVLKVCSHQLTPDGEQPLSQEQLQWWTQQTDELAATGQRLLAVAHKTVSSLDTSPYSKLVLLGLVGLSDPARQDVKEAIRQCHEAGIRVVMVTGDQPLTALSIARNVGIVEADDDRVIQGSCLVDPTTCTPEECRQLLSSRVFARVSPEQKLHLIKLHQLEGAVVAMTGDGVNDAPALKKADIGVAMGQRGTQVAREAATMVLKDDAFSSIVAAVLQGRVIFGNIRKFVVYLLSCNVSEIIAVSLASVSNLPLPLLPLQILFLNLVTDVFPALALGVGEGDTSLMKQRPRPNSEPILRRDHWMSIAGYGVLISLCVLITLVWTHKVMDMETPMAVTCSFLTLALAQLWHVFNMRARHSHLLINDITRNVFVWLALALCLALTLGAVYIPQAASLLKLEAPSLQGWCVVLIMSLVPLITGQTLSLLRGKTRR